MTKNTSSNKRPSGSNLATALSASIRLVVREIDSFIRTLRATIRLASDSDGGLR
jgi:hypothetical protein